ncbi:MAG: potassium/proton antiporter [Planctomycetota bacterium]
MPLALTEPTTTALLLSVLGVLVLFSVLFSKAVDRLGIPVVLLFLLLGVLGGSEWGGGIDFEDYGLAMRVGTVALILILFDGGLNTQAAAVRRVVVPAGLLATIGVALTAGVVAAFGRLFGLSWAEAVLLGAVVSSTDAAAVFAVLRGGGLRLEPKLGSTIEVESCVNDPMAVILTTALIAAIQAGDQLGWTLLLLVPMQLVIGAGVGLAIGYGCRATLQRAPISAVGLYPVLTLATALLSFGLATLLQGSGFLAVFATGLVLGNGPLAYRNGLQRTHDALAWLAQVGVFLMLGLLVDASKLPGVAWAGLGVGIVLAFLARPLAVAACLVPLGYSLKHTLFVGWTGLRGAVPIILATFPVLAGVDGADQLFNLVFFVVIVSSLVPGATIRLVTRKLNLDLPGEPTPSAILEINARKQLDGDIESFHIAPSVAVAGAQLSELEFPGDASVVLIVRDESLVPARGGTVLQEDDHVYVFFRPADRAFIELLFGNPEA